MAHHNTILRQIVAFLSRHEFDFLAKAHHRGQKFRSFSRWTQFMVLFIGQLSGSKSLRDLVMNVSAQSRASSMDRQIRLGDIPEPLRLVCYHDPETGKELRFVTMPTT